MNEQKENKICLSVIIPAAGEANRMNGIDKQLYKLGDFPVVEHSLRAFLQLPQVAEIIVVCRQEEQPLYHALLEKYQHLPLRLATAIGGETRQQSVFHGISQCSPTATHYAIHDGARPMIDPKDIAACLALAQSTKAAAVGVPVKDTIKIVNESGQIQSTPPRHLTYAIQTPQIFAAPLYQKAMRQALVTNSSYTDDCQLVEQLGHPVYVSPGSHSNLKITTPEDLPLLEEIFRQQKEHL